MRLNGIQAEPGTIVGTHFRTKRALISVSVDDDGTVVRFARDDEVTSNALMHSPRNVAEHTAITKRLTPYGLVRRFQPQRMRAVRIEVPRNSSGANREARRQMIKMVRKYKNA